jgi:hypothetical protein
MMKLFKTVPGISAVRARGMDVLHEEGDKLVHAVEDGSLPAYILCYLLSARPDVDTRMSMFLVAAHHQAIQNTHKSQFKPD